jgi:hypothetical protein
MAKWLFCEEHAGSLDVPVPPPVLTLVVSKLSRLARWLVRKAPAAGTSRLVSTL